jgi:hypothetical protein
MSEHDNTVRWSSDGGAPAPLRTLLRAAADDGPTDAELASLGRRVAPLLAAPVSPPTIAARWGLVKGALVSGVVTAVIGGGIAAYVLMRGGPPPAAVTPAPAPSIAPAVAEPVSPAPPPAPTPPPAVVPLPAAEPPPAPAPPAPVPRHSVASKPVTPSEVEMLEQARAALHGGDAGRALALAADHGRAYRDGMLAEERDAIAIEALVKLERMDEARGRWDKFTSAYPRSNYRARLQRLIDVQVPR